MPPPVLLRNQFPRLPLSQTWPRLAARARNVRSMRATAPRCPQGTFGSLPWRASHEAGLQMMGRLCKLPPSVKLAQAPWPSRSVRAASPRLRQCKCGNRPWRPPAPRCPQARRVMGRVRPRLSKAAAARPARTLCPAQSASAGAPRCSRNTTGSRPAPLQGAAASSRWACAPEARLAPQPSALRGAGRAAAAGTGRAAESRRQQSSCGSPRATPWPRTGLRRSGHAAVPKRLPSTSGSRPWRPPCKAAVRLRCWGGSLRSRSPTAASA